GPGRPRNETWRTEPVPCPPVWLTQSWPTSRIDGSERWLRLRRARQSSTALQLDEMLSALSGPAGSLSPAPSAGMWPSAREGASRRWPAGTPLLPATPSAPATLAMHCALTPTFSGRPATEDFLAPGQDMDSLLGRIGKQAGGLSCAGCLPYLS